MVKIIPQNLKEETTYFTKRSLQNEKGEKTGTVMMWHQRGKEDFDYILQCPYCKEKQEGETAFARRPYTLSCKKCGKSILVERINKKKTKAKEKSD